MNTDKTTPRPWKLEHVPAGNIFQYKFKSRFNGLIATFTRGEDAEHALKIINSYDHLRDIEKQVEAVNLYSDDLKRQNDAMREALKTVIDREFSLDPESRNYHDETLEDWRALIS